ncbi:MAG: amidohydrolase family protein [Clostridia bacterium]|nr:amidohydrolase family protein [Clostridia bacterium]
MKVFDMHIHSSISNKVNPEQLLARMNEGGVYGGCIFSNAPIGYLKNGPSFDERLEQVLSYCKDFGDRLFPVVWIDPFEEGLTENLQKAKEKGIVAFKIICNHFFIYEDKPMQIMEEIAKLDMPVIFHSGILWDGRVSSKYNRPMNFEALLDVDNLRFSMGHCSWPWHDECIAMYGKFLNSYVRADENKNKKAEMFFDITPGTPQIYREDLLTKLYTIGYDVGDNIMFGTDCSVPEYSSEWAQKWLKIDGEIFDKLDVPERMREKLYSKNLMRFLGKTPKNFTHLSPTCDDSNTWTPQYIRPEEK